MVDSGSSRVWYCIRLKFLVNLASMMCWSMAVTRIWYFDVWLRPGLGLSELDGRLVNAGAVCDNWSLDMERGPVIPPVIAPAICLSNPSAQPARASRSRPLAWCQSWAPRGSHTGAIRVPLGSLTDREPQTDSAFTWQLAQRCQG